MSMISDDIYV